MKNKSLFTITFLFLVLAGAQAPAAVIHAVSCSQSDVQAAFNQAQDGDTVLLPEDTATWTSIVTLKHKSVTVQGAGMDKTFIHNGTGNDTYLFQITGDEGKPFRLTGITFTPNNYFIEIFGTCKDFRIDHCKFVGPYDGGMAIAPHGYTYGVIDHCTFYHCEVDVIDDINPAWQRPLTLGTTNAVYIEDCSYDNGEDIAETKDAVDGRDGTRYVFRNNYAVNSFAHNHDGCNAGGYTRGAFSFEIYNNTFIFSPKWWSVIIRSGTGVVYNNTCTGPEDHCAIRVYYPRSTGQCDAVDMFWFRCDGTSPYDGNLPIDNDFATYTGTHTGGNGQSVLTCAGKSWTPNALVGYAVWNVPDKSRGKISANTANTISVSLISGTRNSWNTGDSFKITNGYPCLDQQGRSTDAGIFTPQALEPMYEWGNTYNGHDVGIEVANDDKPYNHIKENRDFFNDTYRHYYVPYPYPHPLTLGDYPGQQRSLDLICGVSTGQVNLSWQTVTGAASYRILRNWQLIATVTGSNWSQTPPVGEYVYMVYALDGAGKILAAEGKLISAITQNISLSPGWNWVSFNVLPADLSLNSIFSGILAQVDQVKTQTQSAIRSNNAWKGDLANMNGVGQYKMYKVKVSTACTLTVTGTAVLSANPIPLGGGWNWVAYLPTTSMSIPTALDSIKVQVLQIKSLTALATYSNGTWSGALTQLEPGQGYAIKMNAPGTLIYPGGQ
jgi:hypothetical protein